MKDKKNNPLEEQGSDPYELTEFKLVSAFDDSSPI
jgi:hypothetical protein